MSSNWLGYVPPGPPSHAPLHWTWFLDGFVLFPLGLALLLGGIWLPVKLRSAQRRLRLLAIGLVLAGLGAALLLLGLRLW